MNKRGFLSAFAAFAASLFLAFGPAAAVANPVIDAAMQAGVIGEQADGYLGVVSGKSPDADTKRAMDEINIKRKAVYTDLAAKAGATVVQVAVVTAEKQIAKLPSGQFYMDGTGAWKQK
jgi:uncharacterized protein YdbL (DUF1318 family)